MTTILAHTLTETAITEDKRRFEMTFLDADGRRYTLSIPSAVAADLIPMLESVAADQQLMSAAELTRLPKTCEVGHATRERMVLLRFDKEPPYAIAVDAAEVLARELQEQSEHLSVMSRPMVH